MNASRTCINCGRVVASDRKQRCNHCGEWFYERGDPIGTDPRASEVAVTARSRWGVAAGVFIALVVPISYWGLAVLVENRIAPYDRLHQLLGTLGTIALSEVLLGPIGIGTAGWSVGVRSAFGWLALFIVAVPLLAITWFLCVVTLSGALGEPF